MVIRRLIAQKILPAKQIVKFAPWMIERHALDRPVGRKAIRRVHEGRRTGWAVSEKQTGYSRIPMKLSLDALRKRQRLRLRVPGIADILRQCFTRGLFRNLNAFQERSSVTFLLPISHYGVTGSMR
jgi:CelD/BcsL family acetyltransferase involved in cellulose biosynthesis